jgi:hypothetical protein
MLTISENAGVGVDAMGMCPVPLSPHVDGTDGTVKELELSHFPGELSFVDII